MMTLFLTYGIENNSDVIVDNYSIREKAADIVDDPNKDIGISEDKKGTWNDVLVDAATLYEDYTLIATNHLDEFNALGQQDVLNATNHYCCAVSAAWIAASYYVPTSFVTLEEDYMELWDLLNTSVSYTSGDYVFGGAGQNITGVGTIAFCAARGVIVGHTYLTSPTYASFTRCIDGGISQYFMVV